MLLNWKINHLPENAKCNLEEPGKLMGGVEENRMKLLLGFHLCESDAGNINQRLEAVRLMHGNL